MTLNTRHVPIAMLYMVILSWIYLFEIVPHWAYLGFDGAFTIWRFAASMALALITSLLIPSTRDTRMAILVCMHYTFFLPAIIYLSYSFARVEHFVSISIVWFGLTFLSALKISPPVLAHLKTKTILSIVFGAIIIALISQAAFGGLQNFNLDIERVYEFRRESASNLPMIFAYVYSNVASVLVPFAMLLAFRLRAYWLVALALGCSVLLFGMTHHKSVLFAPPAVALIYLFFSRAKSAQMISMSLLAIPVVCALELIYLRVIAEHDVAGYINSLLARRLLFTPTLLDGLYVDFFAHNPQYYWSTSRIGSWAAENPHGIAAPFLIGEEYFSDTELSANTGVIGSGYSNAGLIGVAIYSVLCGLLLALLNAYGRRIGHALVAAVSLNTVFNVLTTTDLVTAILTHGLLLLMVMLAVFPNLTAYRATASEAVK